MNVKSVLTNNVTNITEYKVRIVKICSKILPMEMFGYLASVIIGVSLGLIGGGGSILTVPVLVYLFHIEPITATA
jgi:hypothetical protein